RPPGRRAPEERDRDREGGGIVRWPRDLEHHRPPGALRLPRARPEDLDGSGCGEAPGLVAAEEDHLVRFVELDDAQGAGNRVEEFVQRWLLCAHGGSV